VGPCVTGCRFLFSAFRSLVPHIARQTRNSDFDSNCSPLYGTLLKWSRFYFLLSLQCLLAAQHTTHVAAPAPHNRPKNRLSTTAATLSLHRPLQHATSSGGIGACGRRTVKVPVPFPSPFPSPSPNSKSGPCSFSSIISIPKTRTEFFRSNPLRETACFGACFRFDRVAWVCFLYLFVTGIIVMWVSCQYFINIMLFSSLTLLNCKNNNYYFITDCVLKLKWYLLTLES